jgi:hypothetical protein
VTIRNKDSQDRKSGQIDLTGEPRKGERENRTASTRKRRQESCGQGCRAEQLEQDRWEKTAGSGQDIWDRTSETGQVDRTAETSPTGQVGLIGNLIRREGTEKKDIIGITKIFMKRNFANFPNIWFLRI